MVFGYLNHNLVWKVGRAFSIQETFPTSVPIRFSVNGSSILLDDLYRVTSIPQGAAGDSMFSLSLHFFFAYWLVHLLLGCAPGFTIDVDG
jgi:hypothetical protein